MGGQEKFALIIAGPTASGKSALAILCAQRYGGTVINADSMQVYRELRVITARPMPADEALVPHALYGVRPAALAGTAAWWRGEALAAMGAEHARGRLPILCGGSGLYFSALTEGLAAVPDIPAPVRAAARALAEADAPALHARLAAADPATAARLRPADGQRVARAWEVLVASGRGLAAWQAATVPGHDWRFAAIVVDPPRPTLRAAIAERVARMVRAGGVDEIAALRSERLDAALPAMRAHGVPEFSAYLDGALTLAEAVRRTELVTGQYTKRQATWLNHHDLNGAGGGSTHRIHARIAGLAQFPESEWQIIDNLLPPGVSRDG